MATKQISPLAGICVVDVASSPDPASSYISGGQVIYATLTETLTAWNEAIIRVQLANADGVSPLLTAVNLGEKPLVYFRFGIAGGDTEYWRPWEKCWLIYMTKEPSPSGIGSVVIFKVADLIFELSQEFKTTARNGKVSKIFTDICREHNFDPSVEETSGNFTLLQSFMSDLDFIATRLIPRAMNSTQMGAYAIYQKNSKLCFTTIDYTSSVSNLWYIPYGTDECFIDNFSMTDNTRLGYAQGGAGINSLVVSPTGEPTPKNTVSIPDNALKFSDVQGRVSKRSIMYLPRHLTDQSADDSTTIPQCLYAQRRMNFYTISFRVAQNSLLQVRDFVEIDMQDTAWSGLYVINRLHHEIDNGQLSTAVSAIRGETNFKTTSNNTTYVQAGGTGQKLTSTLEAKGKPPRIVATSTEGAQVVRISNPSSAP